MEKEHNQSLFNLEKTPSQSLLRKSYLRLQMDNCKLEILSQSKLVKDSSKATLLSSKLNDLLLLTQLEQCSSIAQL